MILTPQQLWKDYDRKAIPLAETVIHESEDADCFFRTLYFNGERAEDGVTRIYAKFYEPKCRFGNAAVIVFDDIEKTVEEFDPAPYLKNGFSVLTIDYAGIGEYKERFTIYPKSFAHANYSSNPSSPEDTAIPPDRCAGYIYATSALRGVTLLEKKGYEDLFILGVGAGGAQVWKTSYFDNTVRAGAVLFSDGPRKFQHPKTSGEEKGDFTYRAAIDSSAYANFIKSPIFMLVASNEQNASLDYMNELYETTPAGSAYFSVVERSNRYIDENRSDNIVQWFSSVLRGERLPAPPEIRAKGSQNKLYYEIKAACPESVSELSLFVAHMQKNSAFRNWRTEKCPAVAEGEYLANVAVLSADEPVYAFVNTRYESGLVLSSKVISVVPSALSVHPAPLSFKRLIYDSSMGISDWLILANPGVNVGVGFNRTIAMQKGPFGLEGVTSPSNLLTTFRLADPGFKGRDGSALQFSMYSSLQQKVSFSIRVADEVFSKYSCIKEFSGEEAWIKFSLSPNDFKGPGAALNTWQSVITLEIQSTEPILVNSLLWV